MEKQNNGKNKTFVRITNRDIYKKLCKIEEEQIKQNGRIRTNSRILGVLVTIQILLIGAILKVIVYA